MNIDVWLFFISTVFVFMITPGPSHLLMLSNSMSSGFRPSIATAAGDLSANFIQMVIASTSLIAILNASQRAFMIIKWAGVAYLIYMGLKLLFGKKTGAGKGSPQSVKTLYWQGFITSAANPKAVIFFAALFPQFITSTSPLLPQFAALSASYLFIDGCFLLSYGKFADYLSKKYRHQLANKLNKVSGSFFIGAALLLGLKDIDI